MNYITFNRLNDDEQRAGQHVSTEEFNAIYRPWLDAAYRRIASPRGAGRDVATSTGALEATGSDVSGDSVHVEELRGAAQA